ncbi:MAG: aldo/keto reductase, partial [Anaerovoracaceae bacterium]
FYLFHNVCELNIEQYLDEKYGIFKYLTEQKAKGRIKHLGFSVHGSYDVMMRFLNAYGKHMEFCQIQLNYLDWDFQDAKAKVEELKKWGIPVWVMEPLRGGSLCKLSAEDSEKLQQARPGSLPIHWAFDFIQSVENVGVTLSGMSNTLQTRFFGIKLNGMKKLCCWK